MDHTELERLFVEYLLQKGFPRDSIVPEPILGGRERPDFAVIDRKRDEVLAIFEIKNRVIGQPLDPAFVQLRRYTSAFRGLGVTTLLVVPAAGPTFNEPFQFYRAREDGAIEEIPSAVFPTFDSLSSGKTSVKKEEIQREQKDTTNEFKRICSYLAVLCLALIAFDVYSSTSGWKFEVLTAQRITLLGAAIALIIVPYAQKIKALGFEYERAAEKKNEKNA